MDGWSGLPRRPRPYAASPWTGERIEQLKTLWSQGVSAQKIAQELDPFISRSAVLAKIHRLGIAQLSPYSGMRGKRPTGEKSPRAQKRGGEDPVVEARPGPALAQKRSPPAWVTAAKPYVDNPLNDVDIPLPQRRSLLELTSGSCRWPVGDPSNSDFFFCGARSFGDKPYCAAHCARAYRMETNTAARAPSARLRRAMLRYRGMDTYINFGGETAAERQWTKQRA
jgi:GcrA cell cycle regulator